LRAFKKRVSTSSFESIISINNKGGFVINPQTDEKFFVSQVYLKGALDGDKVKVGVNLTKQTQLSVRIESVLKRNKSVFTAKVYAKKNQLAAKLYPFQSKPITIKENIVKAREGDLVKIKIIDWRENHKTAYAKTLSIISNEKEVNFDYLSISSRYELDDLPKVEVKKEDHTRFQSILSELNNDRVDLTDLPTITIDPDSARDFDDALSVVKKNYGYDLFIHIADVSAYVEEDDLVDMNARQRANSYYFPEKVFHMLPKILSTDLCSLVPNKNRLALTLKVKIDKDCEVISYSFFESKINSDKRFTYSDISEILEQLNSNPFSDLINMLDVLTFALKKKRENNGLSFAHHEILFTLDNAKNLTPHFKRNYGDSHRIVEECMLLANKIAAREIIDKCENSFTAGLFRNHDIPNPKNEAHIREIVAKFSKSKPGKQKLNAKLINEFLNSIDDKFLQNIISMLLIRKMKKASYSTNNIGHFGLGFNAYTHFTSPIRRYSDLIVHRILKKKFKNFNTLPELIMLCNFGEQKAKQASRDYLKMKSLRWLDLQRDKTLQGLIINIKPSFLTVCETTTEATGYIETRTLPRDSYVLSSNKLALLGKFFNNRYEVGSQVNIKIDKIDFLDQDVKFTIK
tara:strand:+ start:817 stop:2706 length:1890 start_codon:yes stop_codon:yes gene_type:complete